MSLTKKQLLGCIAICKARIKHERTVLRFFQELLQKKIQKQFRLKGGK